MNGTVYDYNELLLETVLFTYLLKILCIDMNCLVKENLADSSQRCLIFTDSHTYISENHLLKTILSFSIRPTCLHSHIFSAPKAFFYSSVKPESHRVQIRMSSGTCSYEIIAHLGELIRFIGEVQAAPTSPSVLCYWIVHCQCTGVILLKSFTPIAYRYRLCSVKTQRLCSLDVLR